MKRRHCIALAILLAAMAVSAWLFLHPRQLPLAECSELYQRYADSPHVSVAFIRDFPVNDTLSLDVTTLTALDSTGWNDLSQYFRIPQLPDFLREKVERGEDKIFVRLAPKNDMLQYADTANLTNNNVLAFSHLNHTVSVFYIQTILEIDAVRHSKYDSE